MSDTTAEAATTAERTTGPATESERFAADVRAGLTSSPKRLPSKYLYDEVGSQLFEAICFLPEYYLTRAETAILERHATEMVGHARPEARLVELGAGSAIKTRILIRAMLDRQRPLVYCPIDISDEAMRIAQANITSEFPECTFNGVIGDWVASLARLRQMDQTQKLILFLGSSIGNLDAAEAVGFLRALKEQMGSDDLLLVGTDRAKTPDVLLPAYDDAAGVTAAFNRNLLVRINNELEADFEPRAFAHEARWNEAASRVEMHLVATRRMEVHIDALDVRVPFAPGESIHTESSHKYRDGAFEAIAKQAGLSVAESWSDEGGRFAMHLLRAGD